MPEQIGVEEAAIRRVLAQIDPIINASSAQAGTPPGSVRYSTQQQIEMATYSPYPDPVAQMRTLLQQGLDQESVTDVVYPQLRPLIELGRPDIADRQKYAKFLRAEIDKRRAGTIEQALSQPAPSEPTMPAPTEPMSAPSPEPVPQPAPVQGMARPSQTIQPAAPVPPMMGG